MATTPAVDPTKALADIIARMRKYGLENKIPQVGPTSDPKNWANIAATLKGAKIDPATLAKLQKAAQGAVTGGKLPLMPAVPTVGGVPDPAAQKALLLQLLQTYMTSGLKSFDETGKEIQTTYKGLNQPINAEATGYLQNLYKSMGIDPTKDPAYKGYAEELAGGQQTSNLNQSTDEAWVAKMKENYNIQMQNLIQGITTGAIPVPGAVVPKVGGGGGGGGGGRGGRGGRGFSRRGGKGSGSGASGGTWSNPATAASLTQTADTTAQLYNQGYFDDLMTKAGADPRDQETVRRMFNIYGETPRGVSAGLSKTELPGVETALDAMVAQNAQRGAYAKVLKSGAREQPYLTEARVLENAKKTGIPLTIPDAARQQELHNLTNSYKLQTFFDKLQQQLGKEKKAPKAQNVFGNLKNLYDAQAKYASQELDKAALEKAQAAFNQNTNPTGQGKGFTFKDWKGYVPSIDPQDYKSKEHLLNLILGAAEVSQEHDPNVAWNITKSTMKDASSTKTSQKTKNAADAIMNLNIAPAKADLGVGKSDTTPAANKVVDLLGGKTNILGGTITPNVPNETSTGPDVQDELSLGFGTSRGIPKNTGLNLTDVSRRIMGRRAEQRKQKAEEDARTLQETFSRKLFEQKQQRSQPRPSSRYSTPTWTRTDKRGRTQRLSTPKSTYTGPTVPNFMAPSTPTAFVPRPTSLRNTISNVFSRRLFQ